MVLELFIIRCCSSSCGVMTSTHSANQHRTDGPFYPAVVFNFVQLSCLFLEFGHIGRKAVVHTEMSIFPPPVWVNLNRHLNRCQSDKLAMVHCVTLDLFRNLQHRDSAKLQIKTVLMSFELPKLSE